MKIFWRILSMAVILAMIGCEGNIPAGNNPAGSGDPNGNGSYSNGNAGVDPYAPCTDITQCCPPEKKRCFGNPDGTIICTCSDLWDCSKYPEKCIQDIPTPNGSSGWECKWTEFKYTCSKSGTADQNPLTASNFSGSGEINGGTSTGGQNSNVPSGSGEINGGTSTGDQNSEVPTGSSNSNTSGGTAATGQGSDVPSGGGDWYCKFNDTEFKWECTRTPPNPTNKVEGTAAWRCVVDTELNKLVCGREDTQTPPSGGGEWSCNSDNTQCTKLDQNKGLPSGGGSWTCHMRNVGGKQVWVCSSSNSGGDTNTGGSGSSSGGDTNTGGSGSSSGGDTNTGGSGSSSGGANNNGGSDVPTGGGNWQCKTIDSEFGKTVVCEKKMETSDYPPGGGWWSCEKGTEFGGTVCHKVDSQPTPQGSPGGKCKVGEKMWCDGLTYCGWGIVFCDDNTGTWKTKVLANGKEVLDCQEDLAGGMVPKTICACYHFYFNPSCCERPDCIVPEGTKGWVCPKSKGKLCDYCNPRNPECSEAGSKCIVTNDHETFCGSDCSSSKSCPTGFTCMEVKLKTATVFQCVPMDYSCYY